MTDQRELLWSRLRDCWDEDQSPSWPQVEPIIRDIFDNQDDPFDLPAAQMEELGNALCRAAAEKSKNL